MFLLSKYRIDAIHTMTFMSFDLISLIDMYIIIEHAVLY